MFSTERMPNSMEFVYIITRWSVFFLLLLIVGGAGLESEWLTWITGVMLGLFLTVHPSTIRAKAGIRYIYPLLGLVVLFIAGSYVDMS